ncbi:MAG: prenyltransferase [Candidatus Aminicenantes bacterium]|nr:prenyltransferase [Candidatus Aminicenantes bacterium]
MRLPFLILTPACVAVGAGTAFWQTGALKVLDVVLVLIGALAAHISVNMHNEYFDFKSGLDSKTRRTPFSGGSGTLQAHPLSARTTRGLAWLTLAVVAAVGIYFVRLHGWKLLPLGILGLMLLVIYTIWLTYNPLLCLLAPGIGFGVLMVMGTHFALTGTYTLTSFVASLVPTFLVCNLLLLNQFPDVEADRTVGRKHYPITIGRKASSVIFGIFMLMTYLSIITGVILKLLPVSGLLAVLTSFLAVRVCSGARKYADDIPHLIPYLGQNVMVIILTLVLLAVGLFIGK